MNLIDTHTHLYSKDFFEDVDSVIAKAKEKNISTFYLPAIDSTTHNAMIALEEKYPKNCFAMMGLHPCSVAENYNEELDLVEGWLAKRKFVAVGEIGLDYYWSTNFVAQQIDAFKKQMEWSIQYNLPIVIHTRNAMDETIALVKEYANKGIRGIFHCFGGTYQNAVDIINMGFYLGIGGVITYKNAGLAEVIEKIDTKHLVLETDSPYLTPVPFRGKRNESSYLEYVAQKLAIIKNISVEELASITTSNAQKNFDL
jgi:TatD DNase family protein